MGFEIESCLEPMMLDFGVDHVSKLLLKLLFFSRRGKN